MTLKDFFEKLIFTKISRQQKGMKNYPSCKELIKGGEPAWGIVVKLVYVHGQKSLAAVFETHVSTYMKFKKKNHNENSFDNSLCIHSNCLNFISNLL